MLYNISMARENKKILIGYRETETNKENIKKIADKHNMNVSEYIRYCVYKEMKGE